MAEGNDTEKTEDPTPKKLEDAKKDGDVPKSQDLVGVFGLIVGIIFFFALISFIVKNFGNLVVYAFTLIHSKEPIDVNMLFNISFELVKYFIITVGVIAIPLMLAGILGNVGQFGFIFTLKPITPKLNKINPVKGFKNIISMKKFIDFIKILLKSITVFLIAFLLLIKHIKDMTTVIKLPVMDQIAWLKETIMIIIGAMVLIFIIFAIIDLIIVRLQYFKKLKMSKQEIKDEIKNMDGDPAIKAKIKQIQMEMSKKRMLGDVSDSDVVITNPTHFAVAIKYDEKKNKAPIVVAKGINLLAFKIINIAKENNIQIVENPIVARTLYSECEINDVIPEKLFRAIAEILRYVYEVEGRNIN